MEFSFLPPFSSNSAMDNSPILPLKTRFSLSIASIVTDTARRRNGTINRLLLDVLNYKVRPNSTTPIHDVVSSDIFVDPSRNLWFRLFRPTKITSSLPVLVFFHGGGFSFLSAAFKQYDVVCRRFASRIPAVVISVEYRLAPEHRFPSQYDDGFDTLQFLDQNHKSILPDNADLSRCLISGDSAGANIAHHVTVRACQEKFRSLKVIGLITIQPFFGGEERTESELRLLSAPIVSVPRTDWLWSAFLPAGSNRDHPAANVSGPNAMDISGLKNFPATLVFTAGFDPLQDWQRRYNQWLINSGKDAELIEFPNTIHAFYVFPELPESSVLIANITEFVTKCGCKFKNAI